MELERRSFIRDILAAGTMPMLFNGCATGFLANSKIQVGQIGLGRIALESDILNTLRNTDLCRFVAVCDLDSKRLANGVRFVKDAYRTKTGEIDVPLASYSHYRQLLADKSIDAVLICVPDHWHAILASEAMLAGKHIFLQKPFTQTIGEGRIVADIAKRTNRVVQVGSWQRSVEQFHRVCELVRNGRIGAIKKVEIGIGCDKEGGSSARQPVPSNLNYEMWLGPTPADAPYNETRVHAQDLAKIGSRPGWIQLEPYGWGMITNWGAHHLDIAQWGLGMEASGPEKVEGTCAWMSTAGGKLWNVHTTYDLHYSYNGGRTEMHVCDKFPMGIKFIGEKGEWLYCMRGESVTPSDPKDSTGGDMKPLMASDKRLLEPLADPKVKLMRSRDHMRNWLEAVRDGDPTATITNAESAHRSTSACSLGMMCMKLGGEVEWDPKTETSPTPGASALMKPFARGEYDLVRIVGERS